MPIPKIKQDEDKNLYVSRCMSNETMKKDYPDPEKYKEKENALRNKEVKALLFDAYIRKTNNVNKGAQEITDFFH